MKSNFFLKEKLLIIFLFFHTFHALNSELYYDYPYYVTLSIGNIFFIHYEGIDIYDSSFNKINQIIQFSGDEEMTKEIFSKIKIKYDNECILSIINSKIYIFNNEGKFLYKSKNKIYNSINPNIQSYSITSIGLYNDTIKYAIGFFDDNIYLNMLLYSYNITENNNTLLNIERNAKFYYYKVTEYIRYTPDSKDLTCEYMLKYNSYIKGYSDVFTCFVFQFDSILTINFALSDNKLYYFSSLYSIYSESAFSGDYGPTFIKSEINNNRTLAFIWFHFYGKHSTYHTIFDPSSNKFESVHRISNCSSESYKTKINKDYKNNELILIYENNNTKEIKAEHLYNIDNINYKSISFEINAPCENIKGPEIFYYNYHHNKNNNYYIYYCFKNCSDESFKNDSYCLNLERKELIKKIIIYIVIAIFVIILLAISIFFLIRHLRRTEDEKFSNKMEQAKIDEMAMNDILTELIPNSN